ncbi:hypothetical protein AAGQ96_18020 [Pantoea sp. MBD-2R]|uniref:hypothetical protein n=1 Tax=unclassified Pantoea TaxID=2630326 RepID=UPI0011BE9449|nr:hypothetical protein [Pantoea sp. CCBC3-3-1]
MKWRTASISLMLLTLLLIGAAVVRDLFCSSMYHAQLFQGRASANPSNFQMGYYDLLSKNSELYNLHFEASDKTVMLKLYNPDDNRLQIKVRMMLKGATSQGLIYDYQPVYITNRNDGLMISSVLSYLEQEKIFFSRIRSAEGEITAISTGQIFSNL